MVCKFSSNGICNNKLISSKGHVVDNSRSSRFFCASCGRQNDERLKAYLGSSGGIIEIPSPNPRVYDITGIEDRYIQSNNKKFKRDNMGI